MTTYGREERIVPTVTSNFQNMRGALANLVDGARNPSAWCPAGGEIGLGPNIGKQMSFYGSTGPSGLGNKGLWVQWDFGQPVSVCAMRIMANTAVNMGKYKIQVSQGGTVWRDFWDSNVWPDQQIQLLGDAMWSEFGPATEIEYGVVPYFFSPPSQKKGMPYWYEDESPFLVPGEGVPYRGMYHTLFFRYWRVIGTQGGSGEVLPGQSPNTGNMIPAFTPINGYPPQPPFDIRDWSWISAYALRRETGDLRPDIPYTPGTGFGTQDGVVIDPLYNPADPGNPHPTEMYNDLVPPDGEDITFEPGDPDNSGEGMGFGDKSKLFGDRFHPYSKGQRGKTIAQGGDPNSGGNGVYLTFQEGEAPTQIFASEGGVDNNYGAAAGNGPYMGVVKGQRWIVDFPTQVELVGFYAKCASNANMGKWKPQAWKYDLPQNSNFDTGILDSSRNKDVNFGDGGFLARSRGGNQAYARGVNSSGFKGNENHKLYIEFDYHDHANGAGKFAVGLGPTGTVSSPTFFEDMLNNRTGGIIIATNGDVWPSSGTVSYDVADPNNMQPLGNIGDPKGKRVAMAVQMSATAGQQKIWVRAGNGNWNGSPTADPATNTGGWNMFPLNLWLVYKPGGTGSDADYLASLPMIGPVAVMDAIDQYAKFYVKPADFTTGAVPEGFTPWYAGGGDKSGSWTDIGPSQDWKYPGNGVNNSVWGPAAELLINSNYVTKSDRFCLMCVVPGDGGRVFEEMNFRIRGSKLQGGKRSARWPYEERPDDWVQVTSTFTMTYFASGGLGNLQANNTTPENDRYFDALVSGILQTFNGGADGEQPTNAPSNVMTSASPGSGRVAEYLGFQNSNQQGYFQFTFARGVDITHIQPVLWAQSGDGFEMLDGSGQPTKWGKWQLSYADSIEGPYIDCSNDVFTFPDRQWQGIIPVQSDGAPHPHWRLRSIEGTTRNSGFTYGISNFNFLLNDVGAPTPPELVAFFEDDSTFEVGAPVLTEPSDPPFSGKFVDDSTFTAVPTIHYVKNIQAHFNDESNLDVFSELSPSTVVQMVVIATGR